MNGHLREIKKYFTTRRCNRFHYLTKVFDHLNDNPHIKEFTVELIYECHTLGELHKKERYLLQKNILNKSCLNLGFTPKPYKNPKASC